jgi:16S rRNA (guanine1207-N2)-methyltransferase
MWPRPSWKRRRPGFSRAVGFFLVANPFLKYESLLEARFGNFKTLLVREYKVLFANKEGGR